jgi:hypothetical protein
LVVLLIVLSWLPRLLVAGGVALIVFKLSVLLVPAWVAGWLAAMTGILAGLWAMTVMP